MNVILRFENIFNKNIFEMLGTVLFLIFTIPKYNEITYDINEITYNIWN